MNGLVSIIVTTKNSAKTLTACLDSIRKQTYKSIELIVVDNNSTDATLTIAKNFTKQVFSTGPERSTQRNFGAKKAKGDYVLFVDSDMILSKDVVTKAIEIFEKDKHIVGIAIPEESIGEGFWAKCKSLERSFYIGIPWMEAARVFRKIMFDKANGYDEMLISGEDFDLSQKAETYGKIARLNTVIYHDEGRISLVKTIAKKYYYALHYARYMKKWKKNKHMQNQTSIISRYKLFFSNPQKLFAHPIAGIGMLFMKTCEFGAGGLGYIFAKVT